MGIFGIADLPVSIPTSPFEPVINFCNPYDNEIDKAIINQNRFQKQGDVFIPKSPKVKPNNSIRNGLDKLMNHFSKRI